MAKKALPSESEIQKQATAMWTKSTEDQDVSLAIVRAERKNLEKLEEDSILLKTFFINLITDTLKSALSNFGLTEDKLKVVTAKPETPVMLALPLIDTQ